MNGGHIYRPLKAFAGMVLEHVAVCNTINVEQLPADDRFTAGCYMSQEFLGNQVDSNDRKLFRLLSEAEHLAIGRATNRVKASGAWNALSDSFDLQQQSYGRAQRGNALVGLLLLIVFGGAWLTHVIVCLKSASWGFLLAGAIFFPVGLVHGWGIWLGVF